MSRRCYANVMRMLRGCHANVTRMLCGCCAINNQRMLYRWGALHIRDNRVANAMLDARITRVAPDVRSALHSMGYFWYCKSACSVLCRLANAAGNERRAKATVHVGQYRWDGVFWLVVFGFNFRPSIWFVSVTQDGGHCQALIAWLLGTKLRTSTTVH
jgi:hypothetical protein